MATTIESYIKQNYSINSIRSSDSWYREMASSIKEVNTSSLIKSQQTSNATTRARPGHLYLFKYDALTKDVLPYYDTFPVIFVIKPMRNGFLGLNMHYLPYIYRARLMDALYNYVIGEEDEKRLKITYRILRDTSKLKSFRPCIKHYLNNQVRSRFIHISPSEWEIAVFLPLQKFVGASTRVVYSDSIQTIKKYNSKGRIL